MDILTRTHTLSAGWEHSQHSSSEVGTRPARKIQEMLSISGSMAVPQLCQDSLKLGCFGPENWRTVGSDHELVLLPLSAATASTERYPESQGLDLAFRAARDGRTLSFSPALVTSKCRGLRSRAQKRRSGDSGESCTGTYWEPEAD